MKFRLDIRSFWLRFYLFYKTPSTTPMYNYLGIQFGGKSGGSYTLLWLMRTYQDKFAYSFLNREFVIKEKV